jgi:NADP-dependent 3-hydroxy acid dehydrogenase YdfG
MKSTLKPLDQQVVVITGASSGIGLATARRLGERGATLLLAARGGEALAKIVAELQGYGVRCDFVEADVGVEADCRPHLPHGSGAVRRLRHLDQ